MHFCTHLREGSTLLVLCTSHTHCGRILSGAAGEAISPLEMRFEFALLRCTRRSMAARGRRPGVPWSPLTWRRTTLACQGGDWLGECCSSDDHGREHACSFVSKICSVRTFHSHSFNGLREQALAPPGFARLCIALALALTA
jgi:hypothetical protein